ncbi:MAG: hypothetical protein HQK97_05605, partial [Nitrospirae bacterium]|nr:hypothetical protein [Nitrospirota bacterium]
MKKTRQGNKYLIAALVTTALTLLLGLSIVYAQDMQGQPPSNVPPPGQSAPSGFQLPPPPPRQQLPPGITPDNLTALFPLPPSSPPSMLTPQGKGAAPTVGAAASIASPDNNTANQAATKTAPPASKASQQLPKATSSKPSTPMVTQSGPNNISLAFDDVDIFEIAHTVFGEILKVNYLIDSRVKGRITFKTVKPVTTGDVLPIMSTIFRLNGVSIMEENNLYRIIPLADSAKEPVGVNYGKDTKGFQVKGFSMIQVIPLNFMSSKDMMEIITPFLTTGAIIKEVPGKNCLIISDTDENIRRLLQIVNIFDDDAFKDVKVELFVFKNLSVKDVIDDLKNTFPLFTATTKDSLKMRYLPIERLNAILVVAPDEEFLKHFRKWVDIIDNVFEGAKPRIYVYPLQNSEAEHIMSILSQIFTESGASKSAQDKSTTPMSTPDKSSSSSKSALTSSLTSPLSARRLRYLPHLALQD